MSRLLPDNGDGRLLNIEEEVGLSPFPQNVVGYPCGRRTTSPTCRQEATEVIAGGKLTEEQAKELFDKVDADKSGVIEYGEFKQVRTPKSR